MVLKHWYSLDTISITHSRQGGVKGKQPKVWWWEIDHKHTSNVQLQCLLYSPSALHLCLIFLLLNVHPVLGFFSELPNWLLCLTSFCTLFDSGFCLFSACLFLEILGFTAFGIKCCLLTCTVTWIFLWVFLSFSFSEHLRSELQVIHLNCFDNVIFFLQIHKKVITAFTFCRMAQILFHRCAEYWIWWHKDVIFCVFNFLFFVFVLNDVLCPGLFCVCWCLLF